jgi:hypothetical protein
MVADAEPAKPFMNVVDAGIEAVGVEPQMHTDTGEVRKEWAGIEWCSRTLASFRLFVSICVHLWLNRFGFLVPLFAGQVSGF